MDRTDDIIIDLKKTPETFKKALGYFQSLVKNPNFTEKELVNLKPSQIIPHLIVFSEQILLPNNVTFLDALFYTNYNVFTPDFKTLQYKTILVCLWKIERNNFNYLVF